MVRVTALSSPFLLGFDQIERALDKVAKSAADGYPPYNIERIAATEAWPERLRITLAVAGFSREDIEVTQEETISTAASRRDSSSATSFSPRACRCSARRWPTGFCP